MKLSTNLDLERCPHCEIAFPNLSSCWEYRNNSHLGDNPRAWRVYECKRCGGLVSASAKPTPSISEGDVKEFFPSYRVISTDIPKRPRHFLSNALGSLSSSSASILSSASAIDSMLKKKNYKEGSLYNRINAAKSDGVITKDLHDWGSSC